ncbi:MAG: CDP-diacylglycerol--serine O-phosphatidyltransferase [Oligoflexales bacterium]
MMTKRVGGAVYILPNLLTTANLFFGYYSIIKAISGDFVWASAAIFLAAVFDILDGRVARLTQGTSEFGVQYDSLCDVISFGFGPAILMHQYSLQNMGRMGWVICFLYLAGGALRLARFNVQSSIGKANGDFTGLPIPMAALIPASFVAAMEELRQTSAGEIPQHVLDALLNPNFIHWFLVAMGVALPCLMVSNISYRSHKTLRISGLGAFRLLVSMVALLGLIAYQPALVGFVLLFSYGLSGVGEWAVGWRKAAEEEDIFQSLEGGVRMEPAELYPDPRNQDEPE